MNLTMSDHPEELLTSIITQLTVVTDTEEQVSLLPQDLNTTNSLISDILDASENLNVSVDEVSSMGMCENSSEIFTVHSLLMLHSIQSMINVFDNVLDDSNSDGWHGLQMVSIYCNQDVMSI